MDRLQKRFVWLALLMPLTFTVAACDDGPAEEAGEAVDNAAEQTGDAVEEATD
jgi:hypothetical protein